MLRRIDFNWHFETLVAGDNRDKTDIFLRRSLIGFVGLILWLTIGDILLLLWGLGYIVGDIVYVRILSIKHRPVSPLRTCIACLVSFLVGSWVALMAGHLAAQAGASYYVLAACILIALGLRCLTSHTSFGAGAVIDLMIMIVAAISVAKATVAQAQPENMAPAIALGSVALFFYFAYCMHKTISDRAALRRSVEAEVQDQKMRALGQLTSGVAHDFNNLLTVISGNIELAQMNKLPGDTEAVLNESLAASRNAATLVRQLLAYSRKSKLTIEDLDVNHVVTRVSTVASRLLPATIEQRTELSSKSVFVKVDGAMLETALLNLVLNSRDALDNNPGEVIIRIDVAPSAQDVALTVEDNGPGMTCSVLRNATDPFFTTKPFGKGSGLGLSMVAGFAKQSGGHLVLENLNKSGFSAQIILPIEQITDHPAKPI